MSCATGPSSSAFVPSGPAGLGARRHEVAEWSREWGKRLCLLDGPDIAPEGENDRGAQAGPGLRPGPVIIAVRIGAWALAPGP